MFLIYRNNIIIAISNELDYIKKTGTVTEMSGRPAYSAGEKRYE